ncbi:DUF4874 domain-containing protein [Sphingobacterium spiritivorum]|uniref:DUF4874 domain-containing protein n=1 Tax=Sphingobacterium spiritivorum TaxID=258 RepID=UPI003DA253BE
MKKSNFKPIIYGLGVLLCFIIFNSCNKEIILQEKSEILLNGKQNLASGLTPAGSSQTHLPNPERGFRYEEMAKIPSLTFPWDANRKLNSNSWLTRLEQNYNATDGHIKVSQLYLYLTDFAGTNTLSQAALDTVSSVLNKVRNKGYKLVLRFAYTYDGTGGYVYPPMSRVLSHLDQLKPVLQNNIDVIHVLQAGTIGLWGEWHNYNNAYNQTDKDNLLRKILSILPQDRDTQIRMPYYKTASALTTAEKSRIGFHNDFFTDNTHPHASSDGYWASGNYSMVSAESISTLVDGEMPYEGTGEWNANYVNPIQAIKQFKDHRYTTFSVTHSYPQAILNWKNTPITKGQLDANNFPYDPAYFNGGVARSVYDYVADHLGYRLWLDYAASNVIEETNQIKCNIALRNYGFSAIHNPRKVFLVLMRADGTIVESKELTNKPSDWHTGVTQTLSANFDKPQNLGSYDIGIWMPDYPASPTYLDARYAMRFCNLEWNQVNVAGGVMGINKLDASLIGNGPLEYCSAPGDAVSPADRYIQSLSTSGAEQNISYTANAFPAGGYVSYNTQRIEAQRGTSFILNFNNSPATKWNRIIAWVDWNRDGVFDNTAERIFYIGNNASDNSATVIAVSRSISVPATAKTGAVAMRIRFHDAWLPTIGTCVYQDNSSSFDFFIKVL